MQKIHYFYEIYKFHGFNRFHGFHRNNFNSFGLCINHFSLINQVSTIYSTIPVKHLVSLDRIKIKQNLIFINSSMNFKHSDQNIFFKYHWISNIYYKMVVIVSKYLDGIAYALGVILNVSLILLIWHKIWVNFNIPFGLKIIRLISFIIDSLYIMICK